MSETILCKFCGQKYSSVATLTAATCQRHPSGPLKGKHAPYQGEESDRYTCEFCGQKYSSISSLTAATCQRHPNGPLKGKHAPML